MDSLSHATTGALIGAAVSQTLLPSELGWCIGLGVLAGSLPDLDFLAEIFGKKAAWRHHRILCHNLPVALMLTVILAFGASFITPVSLSICLILCLTATTLHLFLDVLTSFGTCLWHPIKKTRYSTRSHFTVDIVVLSLSVAGLFINALLFSILLVAYLSLCIGLRVAVKNMIKQQLTQQGITQSFDIEPRAFAPFRWLLIVRCNQGYKYRYHFLWRHSDWYYQASTQQKDEFSALCKSHDVMKWVVATFDYPVYQRLDHQGQQLLLVEDLKWWLEPNKRPMAFTLTLGRDNNYWQIVHVSQGSYFQKVDGQVFLPAQKLTSFHQTN